MLRAGRKLKRGFDQVIYTGRRIVRRSCVSRQLSVIEQRIEWTRFRRETDKAVLRALARWFCWRGDGSNVRPSSIDNLATKSGVPKRSVTRALRRLIGAGWLAVETYRHRETCTYRIVVDRLAAKDPEHVAVVIDHTRAEDAEHAAPDTDPSRKLERQSGAQSGGLSARVALRNGLERHSGAQDESGAQENVRNFGKVALQYVRTEVVEEEICSPTTTPVLERHSGAQDADVAEFLAWWTATYPLHNRGALNPVSAVYDGAVVRALLHSRAVERLQAMALRLWQIVADGNVHSDRSWIARGNRSLYVLRRKAAFLELALDEPEQLAFGPMDRAPLSRREIEEAHAIRNRSYGGCPHEPRCTTTAACVEVIAFERRTGTGAL